MRTRRLPRHAQWAVSVVGLGALLSLSGCDFWPPALQAQIEQLHAESQQAAADKALLQNQLNAANKAKEELQIRVEDLTRVNKEKSVMIAGLEHSLAAAREHAVKASKASARPAVKKPLKPASKPASTHIPKTVKPHAKKPAPTKRTAP